MEATKSDSDLQNKMADLELMDLDCSSPEVPGTSSRVLRKRKSLAPENKPSNRRVSMKPRKHILSENANPKQIEALYLNKKINTSSQTLETIYEEDLKSNNSTNSKKVTEGRKVKRLLTFQIGNYTKEKIKKRRAKIKKLLGNQTFLNRKKIPMQVFLKTIECLELDELSAESEKTVTTV